MGTLNISCFSERVSRDNGFNAMKYASLLSSESLTTASGAAVATAENIPTGTVHVRLAADYGCYVLLGAAPVADANDLYIPAGGVEYFEVDASGGIKVSGLGAI